MRKDDMPRRAAFGDAPGLPNRELATVTAPGDRWLAAVVLGARGHYARAAALLGELIRGQNPLLGALAAATLASHRRQLGGHAAALPLDGLALSLAARARGRPDEDGLDPAGARTDALLGLAADNLALGRLSAARRLLGSARPASWRARVRTGWVSAEVALASGDAATAVPHAERAAELARGRGAVRHAVKSGLVLGAALAATGAADDRDRAARLVGAALDEAGRWEFGSLVWPAGLLLADLAPDRADWSRSRVTRELYALLPAADPEGRRLALASPWVPIDRVAWVTQPIPTSGLAVLQKKPPDRVKVGPKASDRGSGMSPGCRKETP